MISEKNLKKSFRKVKDDIMFLQKKMTDLARDQEQILSIILKKEQKRCPAPKPKKYVAAKDGDKVHIDSCPFAKNIRKENLITFRSRRQAVDMGLEPCRCIKRI